MKDWLTDQEVAKLPGEVRRTNVRAWVLVLGIYAPTLMGLRFWLL